MKKSLYSNLVKALEILEHRKLMIPRYCDQSYKWLGNNPYTLDMIPRLNKQIEETKAAIKGINRWKKEGKNKLKQVLVQTNLKP